MIYPTNRFLLLCLIPAGFAVLLLPLEAVGLPALLEALRGRLVLALLVLDAALCGVFVVDAFTVPRARRFSAIRQADHVFSVAFPHRVVVLVEVQRGLRNSVHALVSDDCLEHMQREIVVHDVYLRSGINELEYRLRVMRRGHYQLQRVYVTVLSQLGLCRRVLKVPCPTQLDVYPDLKAVSRYMLLARKSHLGLIGIRRAPRPGGENDFERLRDYQRGDEVRHIDWKASARNDRLIVRTYQLNRNQTVIFMVDCGRMMTAETDGRTMLDYSLDSTLLLSRIALDQGDRVGLLAFDSRILRYVAPAGGAGHHRRLVRAGFDLFPSYRESNYDLAFHHLNRVCRKRSLVCLVTSVIDEMNAALMESYLGAIAGRHLPFAVLLQYPDLARLMERPPGNEAVLFRQAAAADFLLWRGQVVERLKNRGVLAMEALPHKLNADLINEYLRIKARKLL